MSADSFANFKGLVWDSCCYSTTPSYSLLSLHPSLPPSISLPLFFSHTHYLFLFFTLSVSLSLSYVFFLLSLSLNLLPSFCLSPLSSSLAQTFSSLRCTLLLPHSLPRSVAVLGRCRWLLPGLAQRGTRYHYFLITPISQDTA